MVHASWEWRSYRYGSISPLFSAPNDSSEILLHAPQRFPGTNDLGCLQAYAPKTLAPGANARYCGHLLKELSVLAKCANRPPVRVLGECLFFKLIPGFFESSFKRLA